MAKYLQERPKDKKSFKPGMPRPDQEKKGKKKPFLPIRGNA